jgi:hypothetical protein
MTAEEFEALVHRLEPAARANPRGYARKVALLAALGYGFIALALAFLVALAGIVVALLWAPLGGDREKLVDRLVAELELPFAFWVMSPSAFSRQPARIAKIRGAQIYRR